LNAVILHDEGTHLRPRVYQDIVVCIDLLHLHLDSKRIVAYALAILSLLTFNEGAVVSGRLWHHGRKNRLVVLLAVLYEIIGRLGRDAHEVIGLCLLAGAFWTLLMQVKGAEEATEARLLRGLTSMQELLAKALFDPARLLHFLGQGTV